MSKRKMQEAPGVWAILHIPTGKFVSFDTKCGWGTSGGAKRAWQVHNDYKSFKDYPDFKAICLSDLYYEKHPQQEVDQ